jgi:hypothetical protein
VASADAGGRSAGGRDSSCRRRRRASRPTPSGRSRSAPKTNTTFGSSAGEMAPRGWRRSGLVAGGLILLGEAVGAHLMLAATPHTSPPSTRTSPPSRGRRSLPPRRANRPALPPRRHRQPWQRHLDLDGHAVGTGASTRSWPATARSTRSSSPPPGSSLPGSPSEIAPAAG